MRRRLLRWTVIVLAVLGLAWAVDWTWRDRSYPYEKAALLGVPNLGRLKPNLYRGGQPSAEGFSALRDIGVKTVISFTLGDEGARLEGAQVAKLGMDFVALPWSTQEVPEPDQIRTFLNYL